MQFEFVVFNKTGIFESLNRILKLFENLSIENFTYYDLISHRYLQSIQIFCTPRNLSDLLRAVHHKLRLMMCIRFDGAFQRRLKCQGVSRESHSSNNSQKRLTSLHNIHLNTEPSVIKIAHDSKIFFSPCFSLRYPWYSRSILFGKIYIPRVEINFRILPFEG